MLKLSKVKRAVSLAAAILALVGAATIFVASPASAAWGNGEMYGYSKHQCLDGGGGWVSSWSCNGSPVQIWQNIGGNKWVQLRDNDGKCLDGGQSSGLFPCNGGDYQGWWVTLIAGENGRYYDEFHWAHNYNICLTEHYSGKSMWQTCGGSIYDWQWWSWQ